MPLIECSECKESVSDKAETCPRCGFPFKPQEVSGETAGHGIPALFSFFVPGLGQLVKGHILAAVGVWISFGVAVLVVREFAFFQSAPIAWLALMWTVIWVRQIIDAYRTKKQPIFNWSETQWDWNPRQIGVIAVLILLSAICVGVILGQLNQEREHTSKETYKTNITDLVSSHQYQIPRAVDPSPLSDRGFDSGELAEVLGILHNNPCREKLRCTVNGYNFTEVYLNDDEQPEFIVQSRGGCGSGGCQEILLAFIEGQWTVLAKIELGAIRIKESKTRTMRDIALIDHKESDGNGISHRVRHFAWDGSKYKLISVAREVG